MLWISEISSTKKFLHYTLVAVVYFAFGQSSLFAFDLPQENSIVSEDITYESYDISGKSLAEIEVELNRKGPIGGDGQRWWSDTEYAVQASDCDDVGFTAVVTLPKLDSIARERLAKEELLVFERMFAALLTHEMRHVDNARHMAEVIKIFDCRDITLDFMTYVNLAEPRLDARTDHGRRNGVNLDPTWKEPLGDLPRKDGLIDEEIIYKFYEVDGQSLVEVLAEMRKKGPKGFWGFALTQNFVKPKSCKTRIRAEITLPRLSKRADDSLSRVEKLEFLRMVVAIHSHELRHVDNSRRYSATERTLGCPEDGHPYFSYFEADQKRLDARSNNGRRQGVNLDETIGVSSPSWFEWLFKK